jgi:hypothetical protein
MVKRYEMKNLCLILLFLPLFGLSQNACKKCSEFSVENKWSDLISCISDEIIKTDNINDNNDLNFMNQRILKAPTSCGISTLTDDGIYGLIT